MPKKVVNFQMYLVVFIRLLEGIVHLPHKLGQELCVVGAIASGVLDVNVEAIGMSICHTLKLCGNPSLAFALLSQLRDGVLAIQDNPHLHNTESVV